MLRGWIEIQLTNGQRFKYVRDLTFTGTGDTALDDDAVQYGTYYQYGDSTGDTLQYQGDSTELLGNFVTIRANYAAAAAYDLLTFPEVDGDTALLKRPNYDMPVTIPYQLGGDSTIKSYRYTTVAINEIVSINIVEEFAPPVENVYIP
jgi:hypothetical protein